MSKIIPAYDPEVRTGIYKFKCPGCGDEHYVNTNKENKGPCWGFNGDLERPTFTPSVLVRSGHHASHAKVTAENCHFCKDPDLKDMCYVCHSFVKDGNIQFLGDCTHELAGKTVALPEIGGE